MSVHEAGDRSAGQSCCRVVGWVTVGWCEASQGNVGGRGGCCDDDPYQNLTDRPWVVAQARPQPLFSRTWFGEWLCCLRPPSQAGPATPHQELMRHIRLPLLCRYLLSSCHQTASKCESKLSHSNTAMAFDLALSRTALGRIRSVMYAVTKGSSVAPGPPASGHRLPHVWSWAFALPPQLLPLLQL